MVYERKMGAQVFVRIDEYKDVLDILELIRQKLKDAKETLARINELKNDEDAELETWNQNIEEVEKKIEFVDKALFEPVE